MSGEQAVTLLHRLLDRAERRIDTSRRLSEPIDYGAIKRSGADTGSFLAVLELAQAEGGVELAKGGPGLRHQIAKVWLRDADNLARTLGRERATSAAARARATVATAVPADAPGWVWAALDRCATYWALGKANLGLAPGDVAEAVDCFRIIAALAAGGFPECDQRTFSANLFHDRPVDGSKVFERQRRRVVDILRAAGQAGEGGDTDAVLARFGIVRFPSQVDLSGPVYVDFAAVGRPGFVLPCDVPPYATVRQEWVRGLHWNSDAAPRAILTIENKTSFERHVRGISQPGVCVVYTNGNPSRAILEGLSRLLFQAPNVRLFHWGDFDGGGILVIATLAHELGREPEPHLMGEEIVSARGRIGPAPRKTASTASTKLDGMVQRLHATGLRLEQERTAPEALDLE